MNNLRYYFSLIIGILMLTSCVPNQDANGDLLQGADYDPTTAEPGNGSAVTKFLSKVSGVDSDGEKTTVDYNYTEKKLTSIRTVVDNDIETVVLKYDNDIITNMDITNLVSGETTSTKVNLVYNSGKLVGTNGTVESSGIILYKSASNVTYSGEKVTKVVTTMNGEDPANPGEFVLSYELTSDLTYSGNNISVWKMTMTNASKPPIVIPPVIVESALSNYDNSKNPFSTLPMAYNILSAHYNSSNQGILGLSANNYKSLKVTALGIPQTLNMTYIYDNDGYPSEMLSNAGDKLNFQYIK